MQGFLISNKCLIPEFNKEFKSFKKLCLNYGLTSKDLCIRHSFQNEFINLIAVGINCEDHLIDLIKKMEFINNNKHILIRDLESNKHDYRLIDPRKWPK